MAFFDGESVLPFIDDGPADARAVGGKVVEVGEVNVNGWWFALNEPEAPAAGGGEPDLALSKQSARQRSVLELPKDCETSS